jgi:hypothetical protein
LARKESVWRPPGDRLGCRGLLFQGLSGFAHALESIPAGTASALHMIALISDSQ